MSTTTHEFTVEVKVDEDALRERNQSAATTLGYITIPSDPSEWDEDELLMALSDEVATWTLVDYNAR